MKVLFIGGTGIISSACAQLAIEKGLDLTIINRGQTARAVPEGARVFSGDVRDKEAMKRILAGKSFDVVVNWVAYTPNHIQTDLELFRSKTNQYIFISSASAYQTPPASLPVTESTPLSNPFWQYSRDKIACEDRLVEAYRRDGFPITIVRPSHTYDCMTLPVHHRYTVVDRMRSGKKVIVHGDGTSIWTLTHHRDFARGFVGLLGNPHAIGEAYHITSDELLTWDQIFQIIARAAGTEARIVHIPSDLLATYEPDWGDSLLGDKRYSMIFDNTKIKRTVPGFVATIPFARGAEEILNWYDADSSRQVVDDETDQLMDRIIADYEAI